LKRKYLSCFTKHKGYLKLDPEKGRELFGQLKEGLGDNPGKIDKKERLGTEEINGYLCDKVHIMMTPEKRYQDRHHRLAGTDVKRISPKNYRPA